MTRHELGVIADLIKTNQELTELLEECFTKLLPLSHRSAIYSLEQDIQMGIDFNGCLQRLEHYTLIEGRAQETKHKEKEHADKNRN